MVACWEGVGAAGLLDLVCGVRYVFAAFPCGVLGQVRYLIVSFLGLCWLSYFTCTHYNITLETVRNIFKKRYSAAFQVWNLL